MIQTNELRRNVRQISEVSDNGFTVDAYLVTGEKRALLVDTLAGATGLYKLVRELTPLPLDVVVTHGHGDHAGASLIEFDDAGCDIFMDARDIPLFK
ncbi:MAG: MBL fold metallo-hydrolase, partial [Kiritimatiellaeota bacterium]|nr:MBL fold metallo-hydrolase [Kiritimatiellota bacterium]